MRFVAIAAAAATLVLGSQADASTYLYSYTQATNSSNDFTFTLDTTQTVPSYSIGQYFNANIMGGTGQAAGQNTAGFNAGPASGGNGGIGIGGFASPGPQLYSGMENMPTFLMGSFTLGTGGVLNVTDVTAAVPEMATWAMLIFGFGAVGFAMRRRNVATKVKFA